MYPLFINDHHQWWRGLKVIRALIKLQLISYNDSLLRDAWELMPVPRRYIQ